MTTVEPAIHAIANGAVEIVFSRALYWAPQVLRFSQLVNLRGLCGHLGGQPKGTIVQLENKVAIVTGATSGIGRAIALAFGTAGAAVAVNYRRSPEAADEVVGQIEAAGGEGLAVHANVTKIEEVEAMVARTVEKFGRLGVMVNNAGMEMKMPFLETPPEVWEEVLAVNLTGPWLGRPADGRPEWGRAHNQHLLGARGPPHAH